MKSVLRIAYWLAALILLAVILTSLDYSLGQALLISLTFCPCACTGILDAQGPENDG